MKYLNALQNKKYLGFENSDSTHIQNRSGQHYNIEKLGKFYLSIQVVSAKVLTFVDLNGDIINETSYFKKAFFRVMRYEL